MATDTDLPLLDGEDSDLRIEAQKLFRGPMSRGWLFASNGYLDGRTPEEMIRAGHGAKVRELLRRIKQGRRT